MNCHACGTALAASARFCHKCGADVARPAPTDHGASWRAGLPWGIAGLAVGALVVVLVLRGGGAAARPAAVSSPVAGSPLAASDISQMSTEEMAQRLFDRTMRLSEEGKQDSVAFFGPMALQTYAQLPALDNHARYDVGMLQLAIGNPAGAAAQADTLLAAVPTHLYGFLLRARAYDALKDASRARRAYGEFLRNEAAERGRGRPEYQAHATTLDTFKQEALSKTGGAS